VKRHWVLMLGLAAIVGAATVVVSPTQAQAPRLGRNIKVGIVDTYSGPPAIFSNDALNGFKLALEDINPNRA